MEYQLEMTFETSLGDKVNLTIRNCKSDIKTRRNCKRQCY